MVHEIHLSVRYALSTPMLDVTTTKLSYILFSVKFLFISFVTLGYTNTQWEKLCVTFLSKCDAEEFKSPLKEEHNTCIYLLDILSGLY